MSTSCWCCCCRRQDSASSRGRGSVVTKTYNTFPFAMYVRFPMGAFEFRYTPENKPKVRSRTCSDVRGNSRCLCCVLWSFLVTTLVPCAHIDLLERGALGACSGISVRGCNPPVAMCQADNAVVAVHVTLEEVYTGVTRVINVTRTRLCPVCHGLGALPEDTTPYVQ